MHPFRAAVEARDHERLVALLAEREIGAAGAADHALVFHARVGDRDVHGVDLLHTNGDGLVDELAVMVRPLAAAMALGEAMKAELEAG